MGLHRQEIMDEVNKSTFLWRVVHNYIRNGIDYEDALEMGLLEASKVIKRQLETIMDLMRDRGKPFRICNSEELKSKELEGKQDG